MAKLSARGARKLAEFHVDHSTSDPGSFLGDTTRVWFVLRSDGVILRAIAYPNAETSYDRSRKGYTTFGKLKPQHRVSEDAMRAAFATFQGKRQPQPA
jgi:hypothetical protein